MEAGEIIIKTKLVVEDFKKQLDKVKDIAKNRGSQIGGFLKKVLSKSLDVGKTMTSFVGKATKQILGFAKSLGKLGLGFSNIGILLGGILTGALILGKAFDKVFDENQEIVANIKYIIFAIEKALEPAINSVANVIKKIIDYLFTAIQYLAMFINMLVGHNIFAKATPEAFIEAMEQAEKNSKKTASNLKEAKKQLAGFDELNVLNDNNSGGVNSGSSFGFPNIDFSNFASLKEPKWMTNLVKTIKNISKYWKELLIIIGAFATAIYGIKITNFARSLLDLGEMSLKAKIGLGLLVSGIVLLVGSITNLIINFKKMTEHEKLINGMLITLGAGFVALGIEIQKGMSIATMGITGLITLIGIMILGLTDMIYKYEKEAVEARNVEKQTELLTKAKERQKEVYDELIDAIDRQTEAEQKLKDAQNETGLSGEQLYNQVKEGTLTYKNMTLQQREVYKAYKELIDVNQLVEEKEKEKMEVDSLVIKKEYDKQIAVDNTGKSFNKMKDDIIKDWELGKISTEDATDSMSRMMGKLGNKGRQVFAEDLPNDIKSGLNPGQYRSTLEKLGDIISDKFQKIRNKISDFFGNLSFNVNANVTTTSGGKKSAKGAILTLPKLASGGIVNMPGRGIPYRNAIIGERGAEGVLPLTDSQQMALLGEAIGRYININATVPVYVGNRQIAREIRKINAEDDFAFNG